MSSRRTRLIAVVCVAALLLAAFAPAAAGVLYAILVPLDPLFGIVLVASAISVESEQPRLSPAPDLTGPRAPPAA